MSKRSYDNIEDVASLFNDASDFHARTLRMSAKENGETIVSPHAIVALVRAAERLDVISRFNHSARGVVFLQKENLILSGAWPLKHIEVQSVAGYIARQARKTASLHGYSL